MQASSYVCYDWHGRGGELIDSATWQLCYRKKALFNELRHSLGSRRVMKQLRREGFEIGRYRVRKLMKKLKLGGEAKETVRADDGRQARCR